MLIDAKSDYILEKREMNLTNLYASVWGGTTRGAMEINFQGPKVKFLLDTRLHQMSLG